MALDAVFNNQISGLKATRNQWSGRATRSAVGSACTIA